MISLLIYCLHKERNNSFFHSLFFFLQQNRSLFHKETARIILPHSVTVLALKEKHEIAISRVKFRLIHHIHPASVPYKTSNTIGFVLYDNLHSIYFHLNQHCLETFIPMIYLNIIFEMMPVALSVATPCPLLGHPYKFCSF